MSLPQLDRCPRCGTPYMGSMLPGETPETRYCYTCDSSGKAGNVKSAPAPVDPGLELQPLDDEPAPRGRIPQIAPPTRRVGVSPGGKSSKKIAAQPAAVPVRDDMPEAFAETTVDKAAASARSRGVYSGTDIPQLAPTAVPIQASGPDFVKLGGMAAAVIALAVGGWIFLRKKPDPPSTLQASVTAPTPPAKPIIAPEAKKSAAPAPVKEAPKTPVPATAPSVEPVKTPERSVASAIGVVGADAPAKDAPPNSTPPPNPAKDTQPEKTAPKPDAQNLDEILGAKGKSKSKKMDEEEEPTPSSTKPAAPAKAGEQPPVGDAAPSKDFADAKAPADPNAPPVPADAVIPVDPNQKKITAIDILSGKKKEDEADNADAPKKGVNPFAPKAPIPVTATEPTVMKLELDRIGGNDKTLSEQLQSFMPNWRVRDAFFDNSKINIKANGRDNVIQLNPMNDVLPAKLMCTVEIPAKFAGRQPTLLFEASSAATNHDWLLGVRAMNVDLIPKTKIVSKRNAEWTPVAISLAPLADKHFELQIEVYSSVKGQKKVKDELGLIRNVRIEWSGMKK